MFWVLMVGRRVLRCALLTVWVHYEVLQLLWHIVIAQCPRRTQRFLVRLQKGHTVVAAFQMPLSDEGSGRIQCASDIVEQQRCGLFTRDPAWYGLRHVPLVLPLGG